MKIPPPMFRMTGFLLFLCEFCLFAGNGLKGKIYVPVGPDEKSAAMGTFCFADFHRERPIFGSREVVDDVADTAPADPIQDFRFGPTFSFHDGSLL
jgi:hypothetical protein